MFGPIRAVAIDDEPSHLLAITTGLAASGIPCMGYWFDRDTNELRPKPAKEGLPFLRLVFMDLNLAELGGVPETANLCAGVMSVLRQLVSVNGGPYILVFWTQVGTRVAEVSQMLYERLESVEGIRCPITVTQLPKAPFIVSGAINGQDFNLSLKEFYGKLHENIPELGKSVSEAVAVDPQLSAVAFWESRAAHAAARAVNEVFACARSDNKDPQGASQALGKVLAKIAVAASGKSSAQEFPARALDAGMIDILVDQFGVSVDDLDYQDAVRKAIGTTVGQSLGFQDSLALFADLNTFFHVDKEVGTLKTWDRGVVIPAKPPLDEAILGFSASSLLTTEFLFDQFPKEQRSELQAQLTTFSQSAEVVLVELGADCDHAQNKHRTRRYLVGLEIPAKFLKLAQPSEKGPLRNGSLQLLGPWRLNGDVMYLLVSCRHFWAWQGKEPPTAHEIRYRLRASLVDKLLHHYSVWSSRPGVIEFR